VVRSRAVLALEEPRRTAGRAPGPERRHAPRRDTPRDDGEGRDVARRGGREGRARGPFGLPFGLVDGRRVFRAGS